MSYTTKRISPMIAVANISVTTAFYTDVLGFNTTISTDNYAVVEKDGHTIHFMFASDQSVLDATRGHTDIYIEVTDVNALWALVESNNIPYKTKAPFDQPYGMREAHIEDPDGVLLFFAQPI